MTPGDMGTERTLEPDLLVRMMEEDRMAAASEEAGGASIQIASPDMIPKREILTSECSKRFDRGSNKGYHLDDAERALRMLDSSSNNGYLGGDRDKVYYLMQSLQEEQKKSAGLVEAVRHEQQKTINLKKGMIVLACFTCLLVLANVATSFAAAMLVKDTKISIDTNDLVSLKTGERIGTTNKLIEIEVQPIPQQDRRNLEYSRRLADATNVVCGNTLVGRYCSVQGEIMPRDAAHLYKQFCPSYPFGRYCSGGGVETLALNCKGRFTEIKGGAYLPSRGPTYIPSMSGSGASTVIYPTQDEGYHGIQRFSRGQGQPLCEQQLDVTVWCPDDGLACFMFSAFAPECGANNIVEFCGQGGNAPPASTFGAIGGV